MTVRKNMCYCTFGYWMCENSAYTETFPVSICNSYKSPYKHGTTCIHSTLSLKKANPSTYCSLWAFPANPNLKKKIKGETKNPHQEMHYQTGPGQRDWASTSCSAVAWLTPSTAQKLQFSRGTLYNTRGRAAHSLSEIFGGQTGQCARIAQYNIVSLPI